MLVEYDGTRFAGFQRQAPEKGPTVQGALEAALAAEAGLAPRDVIVEVLVSGAARALPPFAPERRPEALVWPPEPAPSPQILHLFLPADAGRDYARRLRQAAERLLTPLGAVAQCGATDRGERTWEEE